MAGNPSAGLLCNLPLIKSVLCPIHAQVNRRCCIAPGQVGMSCSLLVNRSPLPATTLLSASGVGHTGICCKCFGYGDYGPLRDTAGVSRARIRRWQAVDARGNAADRGARLGGEPDRAAARCMRHWARSSEQPPGLLSAGCPGPTRCHLGSVPGGSGIFGTGLMQGGQDARIRHAELRRACVGPLGHRGPARRGDGRDRRGRRLRGADGALSRRARHRDRPQRRRRGPPSRRQGG
jgi:hypothetical protein